MSALFCRQDKSLTSWSLRFLICKPPALAPATHSGCADEMIPIWSMRYTVGMWPTFNHCQFSRCYFHPQPWTTPPPPRSPPHHHLSLISTLQLCYFGLSCCLAPPDIPDLDFKLIDNSASVLELAPGTEISDLCLVLGINTPGEEDTKYL